MAYPDGTIFESAQSFERYTEFGQGCIFAPGCQFANPCYFGDGCVFQEGCNLYKRPSKNYHPPHKTGSGCVFYDNCTLIFVEVGTANIIRSPSTYQPVSEGPDCVVGNSNSKTINDCPIKALAPIKEGQVVSGCKVSNSWEEASNPFGFDVSNATVTHSDYK